ncbi:MAG TPA: SdpI family protein [Smithella sp.]|nr:SdpI family protein [Smithella sp.]HRS97938.1 SdpI family protein [Smithella sp.]
MPLKAVATILILNGLFVVLAVPLILKKVPRNCLYGFRVRATMENDFVWYEANAYFGRGFLIASIVSAFVVTGLYCSNVVAAEDFMTASLAALIIPQAVVALLTFRRIGRLKRPNRGIGQSRRDDQR